jgi:hypothetical protein
MEQVAEMADLHEAGADAEIDAGAEQHVDQHGAPEEPADRIDSRLNLFHDRPRSRRAASACADL